MMISRKQHEENLEKYIELCREGMPYTQIAKEIGVDLSTVKKNYRRKTGVERINITIEERRERFRIMYLNGLSMEDICNFLHIKPCTANKYRLELGLNKRKSRIKTVHNNNKFFNQDYIKSLKESLEMMREPLPKNN